MTSLLNSARGVTARNWTKRGWLRLSRNLGWRRAIALPRKFMSNEPEPERLSPEWHARECEAWAEYTLESDQAAVSGVNSKSAIHASEVCRDRAAKLRELQACRELLAEIWMRESYEVHPGRGRTHDCTSTYEDLQDYLTRCGIIGDDGLLLKENNHVTED